MIQQQLTECDKEPIHLAGSIQPVGFFITIDKNSFVVLSVVGKAPFDQTDEHLYSLWPEVENFLSKTDLETISFSSVGFKNKTYTIRTHLSGDFLILEGMDYERAWKNPLEIISSIYSIFSQVNNGVANTLCQFIRDLTQFDRVLLYKFLENNHGKVVGESKKEELSSYMNHYFPASDIPVQARALYVKNRVRFIANVEHQSIPLDSNFAALDMSDSILRAVSPIHIEYLKNMDVQASMSISIVVDGKLWGLIACHNLSEKVISFDNMQILDLISHICSREFLRIENERFYKQKDEIDYKLKKLFLDIEDKEQNRQLYKKIPFILKNLLTIFACDNVLIELDNEIQSVEHFEERFAKALIEKTKKEGFIQLASLEENIDFTLKHTEEAAGFMGICFGKNNKHTLILIRKEMKESIVWAGKPAKDLTSGTISPRESFESWEEIQKNQAIPWSEALVHVCQNQLLRQLNKLFIENNTIDPFNLIKNSDACMLVTDPSLKDNPIIMVNDSFIRTYGYTKSEVIGKNPKVLHQDLVNEENAKKYHEALTKKEPLSILTQNKTKSGEAIWMMNNITPIFDNIGKLKYYISAQYDITQMQQIDEANSSNKNFTEDIINSQDTILIVSDGESLLYANHTLLSFFGFENIESFLEEHQCICDLFVQNDLYFYPEKDKEGSNWIFQMLDLPVEKRVVCMISKDLEAHIFNVIISKHGDSQYIITFNDISSYLLKNNEHLLALASVVLQSDDIVVVKDLDMKVIATNDTFAKVIGKKSYKELLGKTDAEIFGIPEDREPIRSYMEDERKAQQLKKGEKITRLEPVVYSDGTIKQFYTKKYPIYNDNDELIATGNISVDVTERYELEEELKQLNISLNEKVEQEVNNRISSEEKYKTILQAASDGIHIIDEDGNIVEFSDSFIKNLGYSKEEALDLNITDWNKSYTLDVFKKKIKELTKTAVTYETIHTRKDGTTYDAQISSNWITIGGKEYLYASARDITEFNKLSKINQDITKRLEKLNQTLTQKVDEQVKSIRQKDKMLEEQSKVAAMGEMVGAIAHQWRQPLNQLGISIQNLEFDYDDHGIDDEYIESFVKRNGETIAFMSNTIDDFRNFFRTDKVKEEFSVKGAIVSTLGILNAQLNHHEITAKIEGEDFTIYNSQSELQQVILNIINNAKDAIMENKIKEGNISILLDARSKTIEISDNGGGISEDIILRIFEPYYTTKDQGKGTGMGLYMSKMIIEKNMNGKLLVDNKKQGAVFVIDLNENSME